LSTADVAARLSSAIGRPIRHVDIPEAVYRAQMAVAGLPNGLVEMQIAYCAAVKAGRVNIVTGDVEALTGGRPGDFAAWLAPRAAAFG
jgi:NAD(P)H dehydrogenase (quinone)